MKTPLGDEKPLRIGEFKSIGQVEQYQTSMGSAGAHKPAQSSLKIETFPAMPFPRSHEHGHIEALYA